MLFWISNRACTEVGPRGGGEGQFQSGVPVMIAWMVSCSFINFHRNYPGQSLVNSFFSYLMSNSPSMLLPWERLTETDPLLLPWGLLVYEGGY